MCLTDLSNNQLVKDEGAQIFYSIQSQTKPIGIRANCEIPHKEHLDYKKVNSGKSQRSNIRKSTINRQSKSIEDDINRINK